MNIGKYEISYDSKFEMYNVMYPTGEFVNERPILKLVAQCVDIDSAVRSAIDALVKDTIEDPLSKQIEKISKAKEDLEIVRKELEIND